jgi:hypothetical protein
MSWERYSVIDHGDPSVGIFPMVMVGDCPWLLSDPPAPELREEFRQGIFNLYNDFCFITAEVDFETDKNDDNGN